MVSHEVADFFAYDALSNEQVRKFLFGRKVESKIAFVDNFRLGVVDGSYITLVRGRRTMMEGIGATVGQVFRLFPDEEIELAKQFINSPISRDGLRYELVPVKAKVANPDNTKAKPVTTAVLTPIIPHRRSIPVEGLELRFPYGDIPREDKKAIFKAARAARAQYLAHPTP